MSSDFVISKSRSPILHEENQWFRSHSWFNGCDCIVISHIAKSTFLLSMFFDKFNSRSTIHETPTGSRINGPHNPLGWMVLLLFGFCEPIFSLHFKHRAGFPQSNGGRILCLDLTAEIYPPLQHALFLFLFISDGPHAVGNFGWDPTISNTYPPILHILLTWKNFNFVLIPPEPTLFLFVHRWTF
jgi:hypothetical protein